MSLSSISEVTSSRIHSTSPGLWDHLRRLESDLRVRDTNDCLGSEDPIGVATVSGWEISLWTFEPEGPLSTRPQMCRPARPSVDGKGDHAAAKQGADPAGHGNDGVTRKAGIACRLEQISMRAMERDGRENPDRREDELRLQEADARILPRPNREQEEASRDGEREARCGDRR